MPDVVQCKAPFGQQQQFDSREHGRPTACVYTGTSADTQILWDIASQMSPIRRHAHPSRSGSMF